MATDMYVTSTVHLREGTIEVEGGEQRISDPLPNPLVAVHHVSAEKVPSKLFQSSDTFGSDKR